MLDFCEYVFVTEHMCSSLNPCFHLLALAHISTSIFLLADIPVYIVPPEVKNFILYFHKQISDQVSNRVNAVEYKGFEC